MVFQKSLKSLLVMLILAFPLYGENTGIPEPKAVVLKSALLPGWGEHSYNETSRGYLFNGIEAALWIFAGVAATTVNSHGNDLFYFAAEHAQVHNPQRKSDVFLDRVSKYSSMTAFNEQMLRNRQWDQLYSADKGYDWTWDSDENREEFFKIKTQRYVWRQRLTYAFGAIALNHLVSTMDALYLKRKNNPITFQPEVSQNSVGFRLSLSLK